MVSTPKCSLKSSCSRVDAVRSASCWSMDAGFSTKPSKPAGATMPSCCGSAPTPTPTPVKPTSALPSPLARRQGAALFELRAALDDYELRGQRARRPHRRRQRHPHQQRVAGTRADPSQPFRRFATNLRQILSPRAKTRTPAEGIRHSSNKYSVPVKRAKLSTHQCFPKCCRMWYLDER